MQIMNLYKYAEQGNAYCITPERRNEADEPYCYRLVADEGKVLTDGATRTSCIDIDKGDLENWQEVEKEEEE